MTCQKRGCALLGDRCGFCERHYRQRIRMGMAGYVDSAPTLQRLERLRELGWTFGQIGEASGIAFTVPASLLRHRYHRVRKSTHDAIQKVPLAPASSHRGVDATGARRRVQALMWMGWPAVTLADRLGIRPGTLSSEISRGRMSHRLHRAIVDLYDELADTPGPSRGSAGKARGYGYLPPAAWDDDIDDPDAVPMTQPDVDLVDEVAVERVIQGGDPSSLTTAERAFAVKTMAGRGYTKTSIATALRCSSVTVYRILKGEAA
jgi:hypothetical protein